MIFDAELVAGESVLIETLAERLGMSRTPVREALLQLQQRGLVQIRPRYGVEVTSLSIDQVGELHQVLEALEVQAIRLLCARPKGASIEPLRDAAQRMQLAAANDERGTWDAADTEFHRELFALTGNQQLYDFAVRLDDLTRLARLQTMANRTDFGSSASDHLELVELIEARHADDADQAHRTHRARVRATILPLLEETRAT